MFFFVKANPPICSFANLISHSYSYLGQKMEVVGTGQKLSILFQYLTICPFHLQDSSREGKVSIRIPFGGSCLSGKPVCCIIDSNSFPRCCANWRLEKMIYQIWTIAGKLRHTNWVTTSHSVSGFLPRSAQQDR